MLTKFHHNYCGAMYLSAVLGAMQLSRAHTLAKSDAGLKLRTVQ